MPIAERIALRRQPQRNSQGVIGRSDDARPVRAHEARATSANGLHPLGDVTRDQDRNPKSRGFLLNTARVGDDQSTAAQSANKVRVGQRFSHRRTRSTIERPVNLSTNVRIRMRGQQNAHVQMPFDERANSRQHIVQRRPPRLPPMDGDQNQPSPGVQIRFQGGESGISRRPIRRSDDPNSVHHRVPGDDDVRSRNGFGPQRPSRIRGRSEVQSRDPGNHLPIPLLRERRRQITGTQPSLQMSHRNPPPERGKRPRQRRRGIPLDNHSSRLPTLQKRIQRRQQPSGQLSLPPARPAHRKPLIRKQPERSERLVDHPLMLSAVDDHGGQVGRGGQGERHRRGLDRFRAGAHEQQDLVAQ